MLKTPYIVIYCLFAIFIVIGIIVFINWCRRIYIVCIRRNNINRFDAMIFLRFCNNIIDIDTGTETCTEIDENEYKENISDNIIYANGFIDIEIGNLTYSDITEDTFKHQNNHKLIQDIRI